MKQDDAPHSTENFSENLHHSLTTGSSQDEGFTAAADRSDDIQRNTEQSKYHADHASLWVWDDSDVVEVSINALYLADSPRASGLDSEHVEMLAQSGVANLPPVVVHKPTMQVIDGMHRLRAAQLRGVQTIRAFFFDGDLEDAFILAVRANTAHGLPLSLAERKAAVERILSTHAHLSDRSIAEVAGLDHKTVGSIRRRSNGEVPQPNARVSRVGRVRPIDASAGRERAIEILRQNPAATIRQVSEAAGVAPSTVHRLRKDLAANRNPSVEHRFGESSRRPCKPSDGPSNSIEQQISGLDSGKLRLVLMRLKQDPSLRFNEKGRAILRMLDLNAADFRTQQLLVDAVPAHLAEIVALLAIEYSRRWEEFALQIKSRASA